MSLPRVLSYPARHPYVDRLHDRVADLVHRDDRPLEPDRRYDPWWLADHAERIDIAHLHLGLDRRPGEDLLEVMSALESCDVPLVTTVHELQPPHQRTAFDDGVLAEVAARSHRLITLTPGAAAVVEQRVGLRPQVIPHGPLLNPGAMQRARRQRAMFVRTDLPILLHAGHVNPNLDWRAVVEAARRMGGRRGVRILVHERAAAAILPEVEDLDNTEVVLLGGLSEAQLVAELTAAHCVVLPYRWATHSGLLELAADVGTPVVATDVGHLAEQHPIVTVPPVDGSLDVDRLIRAMEMAAQASPRSDVQDRERHLRAFLHGHQRVYGSLLTCQGLPTPRRQVLTRS